MALLRALPSQMFSLNDDVTLTLGHIDSADANTCALLGV